jgi:hypothetical protein
MAITAKELNPHGYKPSPEVEKNLAILLDRMNSVRSAYGKPMIITSGLRSEADQARINPSASKSKHLTGQACDVQDTDGKLAEWIKANMKLMEAIGLWFEDFDHTHGWCHCQIVPPKSGKRVFTP